MSYMKMRAFLVRRSLEILSLGATAALLGCVGVSSSAPEPAASTGASTHTVNLSWNASTSADITGYNIYRAVYSDSCGAFFRINSVLNTSTQYADSGVTGGTSYCYATTAVNASNQESGYSNIVSDLQIPSP
jgi:fibronectin type 3 domain-containing protein